MMSRRHVAVAVVALLGLSISGECHSGETKLPENPLSTAAIGPFGVFEWTDTPESFLRRLENYPEVTSVSWGLETANVPVLAWGDSSAVRATFDSMLKGNPTPEGLFPKPVYGPSGDLVIQVEGFALQGFSVSLSATFALLPGLLLAVPEQVMELENVYLATFLREVVVTGKVPEAIADKIAAQVEGKYASIPDVRVYHQGPRTIVGTDMNTVTIHRRPAGEPMIQLVIAYGLFLHEWSATVTGQYEEAVRAHELRKEQKGNEGKADRSDEF
jgi:hypothetical protein